jgi:hypothetical protein
VSAAHDRSPVPPGTVSSIRGRYQAPGLTWLTRLVIVGGLLGAVLPGRAGIAAATGAVAAIVAAPLARVAWLTFRWSQEHDRRFEVLGAALLAVVAAGATLAALGVGG